MSWHNVCAMLEQMQVAQIHPVGEKRELSRCWRCRRIGEEKGRAGCWWAGVLGPDCGGSGGLSQQEGRKTEEGGQSPMKHVGLEGIVCRPFNGDKYVGNGERGPQLRRKEGRRTIWLNPPRQSLSLAISYYWSMKVASTRTQGRGQLESNFIKIPRRGRWNNIWSRSSMTLILTSSKFKIEKRRVNVVQQKCEIMVKSWWHSCKTFSMLDSSHFQHGVQLSEQSLQFR